MSQNDEDWYTLFANFVRFICWAAFLLALLFLVEFSFPVSASLETLTMW